MMIEPSLQCVSTALNDVDTCAVSSTNVCGRLDHTLLFLKQSRCIADIKMHLDCFSPSSVPPKVKHSIPWERSL